MTPGRARRLYRLGLAVLPRRFREEAEPDLLAVFQAAYVRAARRGRAARCRFWCRTAADLIVTAAAERRGSKGLPAMSLARLRAGALHDLRDAVRRLARRPGWTTISAGTLAVGLATAIVSTVLVRDVLLQPLPFPASDRLVRIREVSADGGRWYPSFQNAVEWREQAAPFSGVGIADLPAVTAVTFDNTAARVAVSRAARGLFETLGVRPVVGRLFTDNENRPGGAPAAIVSERFWRASLGGRPLDSLHVTVGGTSFPVVGVLPRSFRFLGDGAAWTSPADIWMPMDRDASLLGHRTSHGYHVVARLRDGYTLERARADMNALAARLKSAHGEPTQADSLEIRPLQDFVVARAREPIRWLFYASMAVLVVSCLNLAAAILAQGLNRTRELSIRLALGASRLLLVRNVIMEALALAVPAVVAGLALAAAALAVIRAEGAAALPRLDEAGLDATAALTAVAAALGTAVLAGLVPALALVSRGSMERLRTHGVAPASGHRRLWPAFIAVQVALSLLLLTGTGLLVRSFVKAIGLDLGYSAAHVLAVDVSLPADAYAAPARKAAYYDAALEHLRATPGLVAAGLTNVLPHETSAYTASTEREARGSQSLFSGYRLVDEGYFDALDIPSLRIDRAAFRAGGALIDRTLQHALWQDQAPEGDRFTNSFSDRVLTVAGVVGTVRELTQDADTTGAVYVDYHTRPAVLGSMHFVVRYAGSEAAAADAVRRAMAAVDPLVPVTIEPLRERATAVLGDRRFLLIVAAAFGAIALLLSAVGVHALVTFSVSRSRREAAIRLALGAAPSIVRAGVARRGLVPAAVGTALGLLGSIWLGQALHSQLFQVSGVDPLVLAGAAGATLAAAGGAALAPARRIARVAPAEALREESLIPYP